MTWNNMQSDEAYLQYLRMGFVGEGVDIALQHRVSRPEIALRVAMQVTYCHR
jgi:hypothetical protein